MFNWIKKIFHKDLQNKILISSNLDNGEPFEELVDVDNYRRIKEILERLDPRKSFEEIKFIWCLIGNIIDEHYFGTEKEIKHGTKHFSPGTKVYCLPPKWGDGYEQIKVIGRHRNTKRYVCMIVTSKYISNWRLQKVYRPYILKVMYSQNGWTDSEKDKVTILEFIEVLSKRNIDEQNTTANN